MKYTYPHTIENCIGEKIIFHSVDENGKITVESFCKPGAGPPMHTHLQQDECLTIISGKMSYQLQGEEPKMAYAGETVLFKKGIAHKFRAEGDEILHCKGWVSPANTFIFFLSSVFAAQNKSGKGQPEAFDGAYLLTRYASEYDMVEIPSFVKKVILPVTRFVGNLLGKYKHFQNAPAPLR